MTQSAAIGRTATLTALMLVGGALLLAACDSKKDRSADATPPTPTITTQPTPPVPAAASRPTTQELVGGKRKSLVLGSFPLRLDVPESWKITTVTGPQASTTMIEGPMPHGEARIALAPQGQFMKADSVTAMEKRALDKAKADPENLEVVPLRSIGGTAKAMERKEFFRNLVVHRDDGHDERINRVDWSVIVFVPQDKDFGVDALTFVGLSLEEYRQDLDFLNAILHTLRYDGAGGTLD